MGTHRLRTIRTAVLGALAVLAVWIVLVPAPAPAAPLVDRSGPVTLPASGRVEATPPKGAVWPLEPRPVVVERFDPPDEPWLPGQRGVVLLARTGVGAPVRAVLPGTVRFAGVVAGIGVVSIDHAGGWRTTYEPVLAGVRAGDRVGTGGPIGSLVTIGGACPPAACLHLGLIRVLGDGGGRDTYVDPLVLYGPRQVRLYPVGGG